MKAADSSLVIAAFASWHESHDLARRAVDAGVRVVEHCTLETVSVLTRLPPPHRASGDLVRDFLRERFPRPFLRLSANAYRKFLFGRFERPQSTQVAEAAAMHQAIGPRRRLPT